METVRLYRYVQQTDPFPFGYHGPGRVPRPDRSLAGGRPMLGRLPEPRPVR